MSLKTRDERKGGATKKCLTGTSSARGIITLVLFHRDIKPALSSQDKSRCIPRPYGNHDAGLRPIHWGCRAADEVQTWAVKHTPEDQPSSIVPGRIMGKKGGNWGKLRHCQQRVAALLSVLKSKRFHCKIRFCLFVYFLTKEIEFTKVVHWNITRQIFVILANFMRIKIKEYIVLALVQHVKTKNNTLRENTKTLFIGSSLVLCGFWQ